MLVLSLLLAIPTAEVHLAQSSSFDEMPARPAAATSGVITGRVVNGTQQRSPIADAEVVLRVQRDGMPIPVAKVHSNDDGEFRFDDVPVEAGLVYLPGANRHGIHYPAGRLRLEPGRRRARVEIVAYDAVAEPSPLTVTDCQIDVREKETLLEVTETIEIANPSKTTYVGKETAEKTPVTFEWPVFAGCETITFHKEFFGRRFQVHEDRLLTSIPWTPGQRQVTFSYELPIEAAREALRKTLPLDTARMHVRVHSEEAAKADCTLPAADAEPGDTATFEHRGSGLPAGYEMELYLSGLPIPWAQYGRWIAVAVLVLLVVGVTLQLRRRVPKDSFHSAAAAPDATAARRDSAHTQNRRRGRLEKRRQRIDRRH